MATVRTAFRTFTIPRLLRLGLLLFLGGALSLARPGGASGDDEATSLEPRHQEWLEQVAALLTDHERQAFLGLRRDYRRDAFIQRFWEVRDPYPETRRNEFRNAWESRLEMARERFGDLETDRAQTLLLAGPPRQILTGLCPELLRPLEIWAYSGLGSWPGSFSLVFVAGEGRSRDRYGHWSPARGVASLISWHHVGTGREFAALEMLATECSRGAVTAAALGRAVDWERLTSELELARRPDGEWVDAFLARSTEMPVGADVLPASLTFSYPGRRQSRTVVQALITVPKNTAEVSTQGPKPSFNFLVDGEVLRQSRLFERFRYRFDISSSEVGSDELPLIIQRYLRPNEYTLVIKVEDLNSHRVFRIEQKVQVPVVQIGRRPDVVASAPVEPLDRAVGADLQEANQPLVFGDHSLKILPPSAQLHIDRLRVETVTRGEGIAKVGFILNGKQVLAKTRPPYSVELDLGQAPRLHTLEAVAYDTDGNELARDRIPINAGPHRFAVRLLEPRPGRRYERSLRAWAEVDVPLGDSLDRLEFYLNETRLASLYQPPFVQPILIPEGQRITYVRALAVLTDGNATEDVVFINTPANFDVLQIHFVELYTSVVDRRGRPVEGLGAEDFVVLEDGVEQELARFEKVRDLPIHAGIILDTSTSMAEELREAVQGGLRFFESVIRPQDRAAVVVFNNQPDLRVPFTNKLDVLAGGLANLTAEGETALFDTLVFTLHYFAGLKGKRALILLSDGQDSASRHNFADTLEFARRTGVAIYTIGINLAHRDVLVRSQLQRLARETAGDSFFIKGANELKSIYTRIEEELRTQYFLGYQSSNASSESFRTVEVQVEQPGLEAKTIPGYYP